MYLALPVWSGYFFGMNLRGSNDPPWLSDVFGTRNSLIFFGVAIGIWLQGSATNLLGLNLNPSAKTFSFSIQIACPIQLATFVSQKAHS